MRNRRWTAERATRPGDARPVFSDRAARALSDRYGLPAGPSPVTPPREGGPGERYRGHESAGSFPAQSDMEMLRRGECSETSCCTSGRKSRRRNSQFGAVVISGRRMGRPCDLEARK